MKKRNLIGLLRSISKKKVLALGREPEAKMRKMLSLTILLFFFWLAGNGYLQGETQLREVKLEAFRYGFWPDPLLLKKGEKVKLILTSRDVTHGVRIDAFDINLKVEKERVNEIEFIPDQAGEFEIKCSFYCGPGHSRMKGKLIVRE